MKRKYRISTYECDLKNYEIIIIIIRETDEDKLKSKNLSCVVTNYLECYNFLTS